MFCELADPRTLFEQTWDLLSEDITYQCQKEARFNNALLPPELPRELLLHELQRLLETYSSSLSHFGLPLPTFDASHLKLPSQVARETPLSSAQIERPPVFSDLNPQQATAFEKILSSVTGGTGTFYFLYGHGGTGKTFLYKTLVAAVSELNRKCVVVASSGIAATLLPNAVTAHSRFKIPLDIDQTSTCTVRKGTQLAKTLAEADLIIWDEAPMIHRLSFEAVDRTLCDIMNVPFAGEGYRPFGGKTVLLGGYFRQTLPVVPNAGREESVDSSLTRSHLWNYCTVLHLSTNMRLTFDGMSFADWTLSIGNGQIPTKSFNKKAIVTPTNKNVTDINKHMLQQVPGKVHTYFSADTIHSDSNDCARLDAEYPTEFLNTLSFSGFPDHDISLKIFAPIMLLRNLNPDIGLCNGTRIMVTYLSTYVIKGLIMGGTYDGSVVVIPRIIVNINDHNWPFVLKRRQFPNSSLLRHDDQQESRTNIGSCGRLPSEAGVQPWAIIGCCF
ncbi:unnamed protein product [Linum tenue]|uniref:ATP-dependent DNA helicase n=1 Tax=Linum tenue TaxID=586396 RepID=A0AAV0NHT3_9ROSI|nr:unnamed protein product [Linum tenue]